MEKNLNIILLDKSNFKKEKITHKRPYNFDELLILIKQSFKNLPENYNIFYKSKNGLDMNIEDNNGYKLASNIIFIKENNDLSESSDSLFTMNYKMLSETQQEELDEKYNCIICEMSIKNESPLLCYQCQKIFHKKCLDDWNNKCKNLNINFNCPKCKYEMPLKDWKEKVNYEEERKNTGDILNKLNNKDKISDNKFIELNTEYTNFKSNISAFCKKIVGKIKNIKNLLPDNIINDINELNYNNQNETSNFILESLEIIENKIKTKLKKCNENKIINNFYLNKNYINPQDNEENSLEKNFSIFNNINTVLLQPENEIKNEIKHEIKYEIKHQNIYKSNIDKKINDLYKGIKNEIVCIYFPNYREANEINLMHDYNFSKDEIPIDNNFCVELYLKNKKTFPIIFKDNIEIYVDNIKVKFDYKYKIKELKKLKVKFKFNKVLNDVSFMFCNCRSLISIDFSNFISNELTNLSGLFCNCASLKNINFSKFNTSKVIDMSYLFYNCNSLEFIDFNSFNTINVKNMSGMFCCCGMIKSINLSSFNTINLVNIDKMFDDCKSLIYLDISSFNLKKFKNISVLFNSCCSLQMKNVKINKTDKKLKK